MRQIIDAELGLEPVLGRVAAGQGHDAGVVDQDVDGPGGVQLTLGEGGDGGQVAQVQRIEPHIGARMPGADQPFGLGALDRIAGGQNDLSALARQHQGCLQPQPAGRAGDEGQLAGLIGDVVGGPGGHDAILQRNGWIVKGFGPAHRLCAPIGCVRLAALHPPAVILALVARIHTPGVSAECAVADHRAYGAQGQALG